MILRIESVLVIRMRISVAGCYCLLLVNQHFPVFCDQRFLFSRYQELLMNQNRFQDLGLIFSWLSQIAWLGFV